MDSLGQEEVMNAVKTYAQAAQRCIALAYKRRPGYEFATGLSESDFTRETLESDLTFLAIVGIQDQVRANVPQAIITAQRAGVVVRMVTGDNVETAVKVAKECHLLPEDFQYQASSYYVMEGKEFRKVVGGLVTERNEEGKVTAQKPGDMGNFELVAEQLRVLARSSPEDKFLLVCGLKELGNVVAVTGDGSNDAPALRKSDVGISMNIAGTPLAKEAADILLMDDNFASIITAIKWGRNIYDCVRKFLLFEMTTNIVALVICFVGAVITRDTPLTAVQMLWVNMIMNSFAALALATEYPSEELLNRPPYSRTESIITLDMWITILKITIYQMVWLLLILFIENPLIDLHGRKKDTFFFHTFVLMQIFNEINCRKLNASELNVFKGITAQPLFYIFFFGTLIVQVLLVEFGGGPIGCTPLSLEEHLYCFALGISTLPAAFIMKVIPTLFRTRRNKHKFETLPEDRWIEDHTQNNFHEVASVLLLQNQSQECTEVSEKGNR
jgi:Ca2+ transporting ATPase